MTLNYKILWIEDTPKAVRAKEKVIRKYLEVEKGYECDITPIETFDDFEKSIGYDKTSNYDLLLVDLNLGDEQEHHDGNDIIKKIRDENIYTEIIFYSSQYENLMSIIKEPFIEGVFTSERDMLDTKAKKIIDVTIKKVQDVNNLRGLIMAEVAELDRIKKRIIQKFSKNADAEFKKYIKEDVFSKIKQELEALQCLVKVEDSECTHDEIDLETLQRNFFYDSFKKSRTVFKVKNLTAKCQEIPFVHQEYYDSVIKKRNVFAHEEENSREDGTKYLNYSNGSPLEFNEEHCIQIRKDIKKHKELLRDIERKLDE